MVSLRYIHFFFHPDVGVSNKYGAGVSEGQYETVLNEEYQQFVKAFRDLYGNAPHPKVTIIVCGKRHHVSPTVSMIFSDIHSNMCIRHGFTLAIAENSNAII